VAQRPTPWRLVVVKVFTTRGRLAVTICPLCAALVVAAGQGRHDAVHRALFDQAKEEQ
jgi:hypothetical protein